jgi:acyl dehydratase
MIDQFGAVTLDPDPLHVDPVWALQNSPFGCPIAFGFLTISLLTHMVHSALGPSTLGGETDWVYLNYGFDRLRLVAPVPSGSRIRGHFSELAREQDEKGRWRITFDCRIEIDGSERPALVGHWLSLCLPRNR